MASLLSTSDALRAIGAPQSLLYAGINWASLQGVSRCASSAPAPRVARGSYTREARRAQRQRQLARRSGIAGLTRALRGL